MSDIQRVLRSASRRLALTVFIDALLKGATAALVALLLVRVAQQLLALEVPWWAVGMWTPVAVVIGAAVWALLVWPRKAAVARRVDEGADLRESLSTALTLAGASDPWSRNVLESATTAARRVNVGRAVPVRLPRNWPMPIVAGLTVLVLWLVIPSFDLLGRQANAEQKKQDEQAVKVAKAEASDATKKLEQMLSKGAPEVKPGEADQPKTEDQAKPVTPEEIRRAALKQVTSMKDQIEKLRGGEGAIKADAMKQMMRQLKPPGPGPLSEVARAMGKGDFKAAQDALSELQKKMAAGKMSESEKEQLQKQLEKMGQQMAQLAKSQAALQKKLADAGLDPKLASNPQALAAAMAKNENLTAEQKQALSIMAKAQESASQSAQAMSQAMQQMAEGAKADGQKGMQELSEQLNAAEMLAMEAQSLDAAMSEAKFQLQKLSEAAGACDNPGMGECESGLAGGKKQDEWGQGGSNNQGERSDGAGQGNGKGPGEQAADENWTKRKVKTATGQGPTIGTTYIEGEQIRGESRAAFASAVQEASQQATESLETNVIPREYHEAIKSYFGRVQKKIQAQPGVKTDEAKPAAGGEKPKGG